MRWPGRFPARAFLCHRSRTLRTWFSAGARWPSGAPEKSKVVTGAPSYAWAWTFFDPLHSCATVRALCCVLSPLARANRWALQQKSKVVTGAPSYALSWTFLDPVHSCVSARRSLLASVIVGTRRSFGAPSKSKVVTRAPSYASAWTFSGWVHSCATVRSLCRLGSPVSRVSRRSLRLKVKW